MDEFSRELNQLLVGTYRDIGKLEAGMLHTVGGMQLSIGELHMMEAIGTQAEGIPLYELAQKMELTPPTVTVAVNKLVGKGYVTKAKSAEDKRSVIVTLTRQGRKLNAAHRYFHVQMVRNIEKLLTPEERNGMLHGLRTLNNFFQSSLSESRAADGE